jgi:hypothetical protein
LINLWTGAVEEATDFNSTQKVVPEATSESRRTVTQIKNEPDRIESGATMSFAAPHKVKA